MFQLLLLLLLVVAFVGCFETPPVSKKGSGAAGGDGGGEKGKSRAASDAATDSAFAFPDGVRVFAAASSSADEFVELPWLETSGATRALGYPEAREWPAALFVGGADRVFLKVERPGSSGEPLFTSVSLALFAQSVHIPVIVLHADDEQVFHADVRADVPDSMTGIGPAGAPALLKHLKKRPGWAKIFFRVEHAHKLSQGPIVYREPKKAPVIDSDGKPVPPPPPPQTFLQKYWHLLLMGVLFFIMSGGSDQPSNNNNAEGGAARSNGGASGAKEQ